MTSRSDYATIDDLEGVEECMREAVKAIQRGDKRCQDMEKAMSDLANTMLKVAGCLKMTDDRLHELIRECEADRKAVIENLSNAAHNFDQSKQKFQDIKKELEDIKTRLRIVTN